MNSENITFANSRGEMLAARIDLPVDEEPVAYALFAHCFTCTKNIKAAVNIAAALNRARIADIARRLTAKSIAWNGKSSCSESWKKVTGSASWRLPSVARCTRPSTAKWISIQN